MNKNVEYTQSDPWFKYDVLATKTDNMLKDGVFLDITCSEGRFHIAWLEPFKVSANFILKEFGGEEKALEVQCLDGFPRWSVVEGQSYAFPLIVWMALVELRKWVFGK